MFFGEPLKKNLSIASGGVHHGTAGLHGDDVGKDFKRLKGNPDLASLLAHRHRRPGDHGPGGHTSRWRCQYQKRRWDTPRSGV